MKKIIVSLLAVCMAACTMAACESTTDGSTPPISPSTGSSTGAGESTGVGESTGGNNQGGDELPDQPAANSTISIAKALEIGGGMAHDTTTTDKYYITGTISDISNTQYGNMNITDGNGNTIFIYGTWSADGSTRYDGLTNKPVVGDTITVYSVVGNYNGAQLKNAWIMNTNGAGGNSSSGGNNQGGSELPDNTSLAVFELGNNGSASHNDGASSSSQSYTNNGYTLNITGNAQMWVGATDAKGNGCIKLGTSKNTGSLTFTVPSGVGSVALQVAKYKTNASVVKINGTTYTLNKNSNDGAYETITVDTSTNKTVTVETTSSGKRVMINSITFYGGGNGGGNSGSGSGSGSGESSSSYTYTDFTSNEKSLFNEYFGEVIPFAPNNEYYVEEYTQYYEDYDQTEVGINFYTFNNTQADFDSYRAKFSSYESADPYTSDGITWYCFDGDGYYVDMAFYYDDQEDGYWLDVYAYTLTEGNTSGGSSSGGSSGGNNGSGGSSTPSNVMTNAGKGLPTGTNGVYNVDFTKATYVKNVTEQYYYVDGCPTLSTANSNPAVLVVPVQFSDVTADSKGYTIDNIRKAWFGGTGETDYYSVHDYYYISSYGQLDLNITVLDDWFTPANNSSYYLNATIDYYGEQIDGGDQLIINEILAHYSKTMDLSQFDSDNNGVIDAIVLINTLDINSDENASVMQWAYRYWNVYTDDSGYYYEYDGVSANDYLWAPYSFMHESYDASGNVSYDDTSVINPYTFIHEFGHVLGADDYYDTSYSSDETPMSGYDVMDGMTGDHNAYTKFNYGWLTTSRLVVADGSITLTLEDFSKNGDTIIIANNWDVALGAYQEYYILVYYKNTGLNGGENAGYFSRDGVVVYHVNASLYSEVYDNKTYYDVYNNNTAYGDKDNYGTQDNLIEYVKSAAGNFTYVKGDSLSANTTDDQGNKIAYTFTVDSLTEDNATITFTKNN